MKKEIKKYSQRNRKINEIPRKITKKPKKKIIA